MFYKPREGLMKQDLCFEFYIEDTAELSQIQEDETYILYQDGYPVKDFTSCDNIEDYCTFNCTIAEIPLTELLS